MPKAYLFTTRYTYARLLKVLRKASCSFTYCGPLTRNPEPNHRSDERQVILALWYARQKIAPFSANLEIGEPLPHTLAAGLNVEFGPFICLMHTSNVCGELFIASNLISGRLNLQRLQVLPERSTQIVPGKRKFHCRFEEAQLVTGIVPFAIEPKCVDRTAATPLPFSSD